MQWYHYVVIAYFVVINVLAVLITIIDKNIAKKNESLPQGKKKMRIRERTLFLISALGGSVAMYITMLKIRHKTKHPSFMVGIPIIFAVQLVISALVYWLVV